MSDNGGPPSSSGRIAPTGGPRVGSGCMTRILASPQWISTFIINLLCMTAEDPEGERLEVVQAEKILAKIEKGEPVEYDNVIIEGDLGASWTCRQNTLKELNLKSKV